MTKRRYTIAISLDQQVISKLDSTRGMISRSRYVEDAIIKIIGERVLE